MIPFYENTRKILRGFYVNNLNFALHLHSQIELLYVKKGLITVTIGNEKKVLSQGCLAIIFPNIIHSYQSMEEDNEVITIVSSSELSGSYFNKLTKYHPEIPLLDANDVHTDCIYALEGIVKEVESEGSQLVYQAFIQLILARCLPLLTMIKNQSIETYDLTSQIAQYISINFQKELSLEKVAEEIGVSKYYLSRVFSGKMGISFNDYINSIRLNYAADMLRSSMASITEISSESGFSSQRTFNRVFKQAFNVTPVKFRYQEQKHSDNK